MVPIHSLAAEILNDVLVLARSVRTSARAKGDRKSTRLNSSHRCISYAVFCLKKKTDHVLIGRFSGDHHWPDRCDRRGLGLAYLVFFFLIMRRPQRSTLSPYASLVS